MLHFILFIIICRNEVEKKIAQSTRHRHSEGERSFDNAIRQI